ncbi:MAG: NADH:flavin oxidoreductase [Deltaproteobacteria bacterium]|nr:NADH:flavin oxidoreductase [Deltaproteobacteria bacterium]
MFTPLRLTPSGVVLSSRTWVPAMVTWRGTPEGVVTHNHIEWYSRLAAGQPGVLVVEATGIRDVPSGPLLRINDDAFIPGLAELVRAVRAASGGATRVLLQVIDFLRVRRRPTPARFFAEYLVITTEHKRALALPLDAPEHEVRTRLAALPASEMQAVLTARECEALWFGERETVNDTHLPHIRELPILLPHAFARAAQRAQAAGFDGVELHFAHAYTMASFLSPLNRRNDGYGGSLANRLRLPLEVFAAVRAATPLPFLVGARMLAAECIPGGFDEAEARQMGVAFAQAGFDFLSLSRGGKFEDARQPPIGKAAYPYTGASGAECIPPAWLRKRGQGSPEGRNLVASAHVRAAVRAAGLGMPIVAAGGLHTVMAAEAAIANEKADIIASARQSLADPLWLKKAREGRSHEIRRCTLSNYCEGLDQMHKVVTCKLWDRRPLQPGEPRDERDGRALLPPLEERAQNTA